MLFSSSGLAIALYQNQLRKVSYKAKTERAAQDSGLNLLLYLSSTRDTMSKMRIYTVVSFLR